MEFNYGQPTVPPGGVMSFPDHLFVDQPSPARDIKDSAFVRGSASPGGGIVGSATSQGHLGN